MTTTYYAQGHAAGTIVRCPHEHRLPAGALVCADGGPYDTICSSDGRAWEVIEVYEGATLGREIPAQHEEV